MNIVVGKFLNGTTNYLDSPSRYYKNKYIYFYILYIKSYITSQIYKMHHIDILMNIYIYKSSTITFITTVTDESLLFIRFFFLEKEKDTKSIIQTRTKEKFFLLKKKKSKSYS